MCLKEVWWFLHLVLTSQTNVSFGVFLGCDLGLVHNFFLEAFTLSHSFFCSCGILYKDVFHISINYLHRVWHAAVDQFDGVSVENFPPFVASWKAFVSEADEHSSYISFDVSVEWWIKPYYIFCVCSFALVGFVV